MQKPLGVLSLQPAHESVPMLCHVAAGTCSSLPLSAARPARFYFTFTELTTTPENGPSDSVLILSSVQKPREFQSEWL